MSTTMTTTDEFRGFYFSVAKPADQMTADECCREIESYEFHESLCREIGHGISTKEFVRMNMCRERLVSLQSPPIKITTVVILND